MHDMSTKVARAVVVLGIATALACSGTGGDDNVGGASDPTSTTPTTPAALPPAATTQDPDAPDLAAMCAQGEPDCDDTVEVPSPLDLPDASGAVDPAAGTCLAGATECADNPGLDQDVDVIDAVRATPMTDLLDVHPTPWASVTFNQDQTIATVAWFGADPACEGLDQAIVDLFADRVVVTVMVGTIPDATCDLPRVLRAIEVDMGETLGPRSVLDGALD